MKNRRTLIGGVIVICIIFLVFWKYLYRKEDPVNLVQTTGILGEYSAITYSVTTELPLTPLSLVTAPPDWDGGEFIQPNSSNYTNATISGTTLIIGGFNDILYDIASHLNEQNHKVAIMDSRFESTEEQVLISEKLKKKKKIDFTDSIHSVEDVGTLLFIPPTTLSFEITHRDNGIGKFGKLLEHFVEFLKSESLQNKRIVFLPPLMNDPIHEATLETFSLILKSYRSSYNLNVLTAHMEQGFNKNSCSNFEDLISFIYSKHSSDVHWGKFVCRLRKEATEQPDKEKHNILFSTYFTNNKQFVRPYRENSFQFVKGFVVTAKKYNARIVIYYDRIDSLYKERLLEFYSNIEFIHYTGNYHHRTINDARFYIMYEYLQAHPEVDRVILQDLRDGIYLTDPFKVMELAGDYLFVGKDVSFHLQFSTMRYYRTCESKKKQLFKRPRPHPMLNAGTLGGTRHMVMAFLKEIMRAFDEVFPSRLNCNMDAFDYVAHQYFSDVMYSGYPFQGFMQIELASPSGIAIRHKRTKFDL